MGRLTAADLDEIEAALRSRRLAVVDAVRARLAVAGAAPSARLAARLAEVSSRLADDLPPEEAMMVRNGLEQLRAIDDALRRIEFGVGGLCTQCGAQIAIARLRMLPQAATCAACDALAR